MIANVTMKSALAASLMCVAVVSTTKNAATVTAEVARKCAALTAKAYPPRVVGNPAAGSTKGSELTQQEYFKRCVANGGDVGE